MLYLRTMKNFCYNNIRYYSQKIEKLKPPWNVIFFGTDNFSLASLRALTTVYKEKDTINRLEIVTTIKNKMNPVCKYAKEENLEIHPWPLTSISGFHIGVVVSFGYLIPQYVIKEFPLGMLNVHASLLPRWRGAAPIIHAIANGDEKTGISIMRIEPKHFDIGEIVTQKVVGIENDVIMPVLYETLANLGAEILVEELYKLPDNLLRAKRQSNVGITYAPKVTSSFATIDWSKMSAKDVYNLSRALVGLYPLLTSWNGTPIKLFDVKLCDTQDRQVNRPGFVVFDKTDALLKVRCTDGKWVSVGNIAVQNKRMMTACDFNNGYLKKVDVNRRIFK